jgi:hypothetical protein
VLVAIVPIVAGSRQKRPVLVARVKKARWAGGLNGASSILLGNQQRGNRGKFRHSQATQTRQRQCHHLLLMHIVKTHIY